MEFPKMLYKGEPTSQEHLNWLVSIPHEALARVVVGSQEAEDALRAEGFKAMHEFVFEGLAAVEALEQTPDHMEEALEAEAHQVAQQVDQAV